MHSCGISGGRSLHKQRSSAEVSTSVKNSAIPFGHAVAVAVAVLVLVLVLCVELVRSRLRLLLLLAARRRALMLLGLR